METPCVMQTVEPERELYLCICGSSESQPLYSLGPAAKPNYTMQYVLEGRGICELDGKNYELGPGDGILIEPETVAFCREKEAPWNYLWLEFAGSAVRRYLKAMGFVRDNPLFHSERIERFQEIVREMKACGSYRIQMQLYRSALLYECFSLISHRREPRYIRVGQEERRQVRGAVEYIRNNFASPIRIAEIADYVQINRSYLYVLFRDALGMSPMDYLTHCRLLRARVLLEQTSLPMKSVAYSCGYRDGLVFSKAYKQKTGMTPSQYRKQYRKQCRQRAAEQNTEQGGQVYGDSIS